MNKTKGFTEQTELHKLREKCVKLEQELQITKTYFELALDRSDPYPAIKDGLNRVKNILENENELKQGNYDVL